MYRKIISLLTLLIVTCSLFAQSTIEDRVAKIINALNTKNSEALISQLDDSCKIANLPRGHNSQVIPMVLRNYTAITSYKIVKQTTEGTNMKVFLDVTYENGAPGHPWFLLNDTKILEMHIIKDVSASKDDDIGKATAGGKLPEVMVIHFNLYDNLIYVDAEVNGISGMFELDCGSPVILLDKRYFPDNANNTDVANQLNLTGFGGKMNQVSLKQINTLKWGNMELHDFKAASVTMDNKESVPPGKKVLGLLGYEVFKDYEITLDYKSHTLIMKKVDETGNYIVPEIHTQAIRAEVAIVMQRHIPIIPISIAGKTYHMGIDCGANANVLYSKYYDQVKALLSQPMAQELNTANNSGGSAQTYLLQSASLNSLIFKSMLTILSDDNMYMQRAENKLQIDGLLGAPFLSQYIIAINFKKGIVRFY